jgi:hypothetical protein
MLLRSSIRQLLIMSIALITACGEQTATTVPTASTTTTVAVNLPKTGQTLCYDAAGAIISCAGTGQDGELLKGGSWANPRFTDQLNSTMLDNNTGLIWTRDANAPGPAACTPASIRTWQSALDYVKCLNTNSYLGFTDWRLPNVVELRSLINTSQSSTSTWLITQGFTGVQVEAYWSSSSAADGPSSAWGVGMSVGDVDGNDKSDNGYAWPVRSGQSGSYIFLPPRTGQTLCYDFTGAVTPCAGTGQDGDTLKGEVWPNLRFTDLANGTMKDNLTNLIWSKDANAPGPATCTPAATKNWQSALDYVKCLNTNSYLGFTDWSLPNRNELSSLIDHARLNQATWLVSLGFTDVQAVYYWSSSSSADSSPDAWGVDMGDGDVDGDNKVYSQYAWPVRSGQ